MANVRQPYFEVIYNSRDVTEDVSPDVIEITYTDSVEGEADELVILLDDQFSKWKNEWRSSNGDKVSVKFGWSSSNLLDCGDFEVDEVDYSGSYGSGSTVSIRCLAIPMNSGARDLRSEIYENQTLRQIALKVADRNGWSLVSYFPIQNFEIVQTIGKSLAANQVIETRLLRVVQNKESDIAFINRLGAKFGLTFSVRSTNMYFLLSYDVESIAPIEEVVVYEIDDILAEARANAEPSISLKSYRLKDCAEKIASGVDVRSNDPFSNAVFVFPLDNDQNWAQYMTEKVNSGYGLDSILGIKRRLQIFEFVENSQQAELVASAALYKVVSKQVSGDMELEGVPNIVAGVSFNVGGLGSLSGRYFVEQSRHRINRGSGWVVNAQVKQLSWMGN